MGTVSLSFREYECRFLVNTSIHVFRRILLHVIVTVVTDPLGYALSVFLWELTACNGF